MADTVDDLSAPLGQKTERRKRRFRLPFTAMQALATLLGLFLLTFAGYALFHDDPLGGEPLTRIAIAPSGDDDKPAAKGHESSTEKPAAAGHGAEPSAHSATGPASEQRTV